MTTRFEDYDSQKPLSNDKWVDADPLPEHVPTHPEKPATLHLTHSGYYAGAPICGAKRNEADEYMHYSVCYQGKPKHKNLCVDCSRIYDELESER